MSTGTTLKPTNAALVALALTQSALAIPSVSVDSVIQRWPWNNKVDITYTISDGLDMANGTYYRLEFTATVNGTTYAIDGSSDVIAKASTGTHTVTWDAPSGLKATNCTMVASLCETTGDYMIIDLGTGAYAFAINQGGTWTVTLAAGGTELTGMVKLPDGFVLSIR